MNKSKMLSASVIFCFFIEAVCLTQGKRFFGPYISAIVFFISGLLIAILPILSQKPITAYSFFPLFSKTTKYRDLAFTLIGLLISVIIFSLFSTSIKKYPVDINYSDILPTIDTMASRAIRNGVVYRDSVNYGTFVGGKPGYLPMHWLPAVVPKYFGLDIRLAVISVFILGFSCYFFGVKKFFSLKVILPALFLIFPAILLLSEMEQVIAGTAELMVVGYYIVLCVGVVTKNKFLIGAGLVCCLLSRYSLILWLPFYFILFWQNEGRNKTIRLALWIVTAVVFLFILPFYWQNPDLLSGVMKSYTNSVPMYEWGGQYWQSPGQKPYQLFQGLGLACFIYDFTGGSLTQKIGLLLKLQIVFSGLSILIAGMWYKFKNKERIDYSFFSLLVLKFYLCFFYSLIAVPYSYLFLVPVFISMIILTFFLETVGRNDSKSSDNEKRVSKLQF